MDIRIGKATVDTPPIILQPCRDGLNLVISPASPLPNRCVKCNAPADGFRSVRTIFTHSPWYPLFSSAGWNAHCVDDCPILIFYGLCPRHRLKLLGRVALLVSIALANLICLVLIRLCPAMSNVLEALAVVLPIVFTALVLTFRPLLRPRRVHHGIAWFAGAGPHFLDSLPDLNSPSRPDQASPEECVLSTTLDARGA